MNNETVASSIVDLEYLRMVCAGSEDMVSEFVHLFLKQNPSEIQIMYQCLQNKDWDALNSAAHKTKSSTSVLGINDIKEDIEAIEIWAANQENLEQIPQRLDRVAAVCQKACQELNQLDN